MKKRLFSLIMVLVLTVSFIGVIPASADSSTFEITVSCEQKTKMASDALDLINAERKAAGVSVLKMDKNLTTVAAQRAAEISVEFAHVRPDGRTCFEGFDAYGYNRGTRGENVAYGYDTAKDVYEGWKHSTTGHHEQYMNGAFTKTGIVCLEISGVHYWVQVFQSGSEITSYTQTVDFSVTKTVKVTNNAENKAKYMPGSTPEISSLTTDASGKVTVMWNPVANASGYRVYRYYNSLKGYNIVKEISSGSTTQFIDTDVEGGDTPKYKIKAYREIGSNTTWTPYSGCSSILVKPETPSIYKTDSTSNSIKIDWTYTKCAGYKVYRVNSDSKAVMIAEITDPNTTSYTVSNLNSNTEYKFKMRSYYLFGGTYIYSNYSPEYSAKTN